ncbi:MAG: sugar ABC transporter substrate-binding protein [Rhodococcus sp. (in: high G+C Gram-positive bacteria)]|uniref:sugar ABC transporter substrate-binding protein n=1 Tax=Rhodococcus sp. TaxID=1831 RepID=UPI00121D0C64|nr:substrate-binding domain-containing protein [Rhodococcus sp. (in: high G+C Gram-positive bacteria)]RZL23103.1 MAG: sugar ABC transporter substrate-binding protein [Rhodococcus sp. (in: high G+C Gram-positive bacteria)]
MKIKRHHRLGMLITGAVIGSLALAACSSSSDGGRSGGGEVSQEVTNLVAEYQDAPAAIKQTEPLNAAPAKKSVAFIVCADPTCTVLGDALSEAVKSFGWDYTGINAPATDFGSAVQQAVDLDVDYIAGTGSDIATFQNAFDSAADAGIPYFSCYSSDIPEGGTNNLFANCYDLSAVDSYSRVLTSWVIEDSGADASIGVVNIPEYPTLSNAVEGVENTLAEFCDTCSSQPVDISLDVFASGGSTNAIISFLQSNPDVNYLYLAFGNFETGLGQALKSAGFDGVKVVGVQPQQSQIQSLVNGETHAWIATPQENAMWTLADQMARVANNAWDKDQERTAAVPPIYIIDTVEEAEAVVDLQDGWPGPDGFKDQYKALWGLN